MTKTFCFDAVIFAKHDKAAIVFEKVWFLMHKADNAPDYTTIDKDGVVWEHWTHQRLLEQFETTLPNGDIVNVIGAERTLRRMVDDLVTAKLFIRKRSQVGFKLAINFKALQALVGFDARYGLYPSYETECPEMDKAKEETKEDPLAECPDLDKQPSADTQNVLNETNRVSEDGQTECPDMDTAYIYDSLSLESLKEDSKEKDSKDSTTTLPNGSGAKAPAPPAHVIYDDLLDLPHETLPPKDVFTAISWIAYPGQRVTDHARDEILAAMNRLQNIETGQKEKLVLDPTALEDYALWRIVIWWKGKDGFPNIKLFEDEFREAFILNWYASETNRKQLELIRRDFPDWRTRLFKGDYAAFRREAQAFDTQRRSKQKNSANPTYDPDEIPDYIER